MKKNQWKKKILAQMQEANTYRESFDSVIDTLSEVLEVRDATYAQFKDEGAEPVIVRTSDRGAKNLAENPLLKTWRDLNGQALNFWRDLGLTPKGLKQIDEQALLKKTETDPLAEVLKGLDG